MSSTTFTFEISPKAETTTLRMEVMVRCLGYRKTMYLDWRVCIADPVVVDVSGMIVRTSTYSTLYTHLLVYPPCPFLGLQT